MCKKVMYTIKKIKKCGGGGRGRGNIRTQNTLNVFKKNNKKSKKKT